MLYLRNTNDNISIKSCILLFIQYVNNVGIPIVLMGVLSVCAGVLTLRLPETKGKPTPETLEELRKDADLVFDDL